MIDCYFISGLGADKAVFSRLKLRKDIVVHHLPWLKPHYDEKIEHYACRMAEEIENPQEAVLIGLSFGGMMAIEIAKLFNVKQTILISSIKKDDEMPPWLRFIGNTGMHKLVAIDKLLQQRELSMRFFGCNSKDDRVMLQRLLDEADLETVAWSIDRALNWKNQIIPDRLVHIHGTADTVFPKLFSSPDYWIEQGSHFMVFSQAEKTSVLLNAIISEG
ncbi:MAG: alpha/beta hydrolase [Salibacteraceae bacterium]